MQWAGREHYKVGQRVLDWGSGCGHKASWMRQLFGVYVYGIDVEPAPVKWAQRHSMGSFCVTDGTDLTFLPSSYFHHVHSNGAIHHLPLEKQCHVLHDFIRVTMPGGSISMSWMGNHLKDNPSPEYSFWRDCVSDAKNVDISFAREKDEVVGNWGLGPLDENDWGRNLPNYSVRITLRAVADDAAAAAAL